MTKAPNSTDNLQYLRTAKAHAEDGQIGEAAARSILDIAEEAALRCERLARTIYIHLNEAEIRKSLPDDDVDFVISRKGYAAT